MNRYQSQSYSSQKDFHETLDPDMLSRTQPDINLYNLVDKQVTRTSNLPVNDHMQKLEVMLAEIVNDLEASKKNMQMLRGEFLNIGHIEVENNAGLTQLIQDEAIRVGKNFKKQQDEEFKIHKDYIAQIKLIREDRKLLTNKASLIEHRIFENEHNVGFKNAYALRDNINENEQNFQDEEEY